MKQSSVQRNSIDKRSSSLHLILCLEERVDNFYLFLTLMDTASQFLFPFVYVVHDREEMAYTHSQQVILPNLQQHPYLCHNWFKFFESNSKWLIKLSFYLLQCSSAVIQTLHWLWQRRTRHLDNGFIWTQNFRSIMSLMARTLKIEHDEIPQAQRW